MESGQVELIEMEEGAVGPPESLEMKADDGTTFEISGEGEAASLSKDSASTDFLQSGLEVLSPSPSGDEATRVECPETRTSNTTVLSDSTRLPYGMPQSPISSLLEEDECFKQLSFDSDSFKEIRARSSTDDYKFPDSGQTTVAKDTLIESENQDNFNADHRDTSKHVAFISVPTIHFDDCDTVRAASSGDDSAAEICRICHFGVRSVDEPLISPCLCSGTVEYTHQTCLTKWLSECGTERCEICGYRFRFKTIWSFSLSNFKPVRLNRFERLHVVLTIFTILVLGVTAAYICWVALSSHPVAARERSSQMAQILLPVYSALDAVAVFICIYECQNTIVRIWRRWKILNLGVQVVDRFDQRQQTNDDVPLVLAPHENPAPSDLTEITFTFQTANAADTSCIQNGVHHTPIRTPVPLQNGVKSRVKGESASLISLTYIINEGDQNASSSPQTDDHMVTADVTQMTSQKSSTISFIDDTDLYHALNDYSTFSADDGVHAESRNSSYTPIRRCQTYVPPDVEEEEGEFDEAPLASPEF